MRKIISTNSLLIICFWVFCCTSYAQHNADDAPKNYCILFVGNSLTLSNNLPALVAEEAMGRGIYINTEVLAYPNYALEDHWNDKILQKKLLNRNFDFVILQQGPSSQPEGREMLIEYGMRIKELCAYGQTKLVFFMVWPASQNYQMFEGVIRNYADAADLSKAILCPVGQQWKNYIDRTNDFSYYGLDGFHPSLTGSKKAAEIIVDSIFK
ncbi:MAG: SGNH/GDSL hydrolase family protein [Cyclobacteriaceae bacterium]|nr:SGNH/GDSL hydrolase family protein [Cyclobacteriaceae bacterium]